LIYVESLSNWLLECCDYEEQKLRLQDIIEDAWETMFNQGLEEPLVDQTGCLYAKGVPQAGVSGAYEPISLSCTLTNPPACKIGEFWANHGINLEALSTMGVDTIEAQPRDTAELEKVKSAAQQVRAAKGMCGKRCTVDLSDAIICLESTHCPETVAVHSINKKHFRPLCELFGIESEPKD